MKIHNKLVRDKIPEIIKSDGRIATIHYLTIEEYKRELDKKLQEEVEEYIKDDNIEEVEEYIKDDNIEELADICEVIEAILEYKNISLEAFKKIKDKKKDFNGGFTQRIFLETTE